MSVKLKLIKSKAFEAKGVNHTHYTAAYKGRVFGVSTMRFDAEDIEVKDDVITIKTEVEVLKNTVNDSLDGTSTTYLDLVPKSGLVLAEF